jgi:hypothetical protein
MKHHFDDPLRTIYKDIIQPLIGNFFEVDAVFAPIGIIHNEQPCSTINIDNNMQSKGQLIKKRF